MKSFKDLTTVDRGAPCKEYPGKWLVFYPWRKNEEADCFPSLEEAVKHGESIIEQAEKDKREYNPRCITVCWQCSDDDPRQGQVWFTGFYRHGHFSFFGGYKTI